MAVQYFKTQQFHVSSQGNLEDPEEFCQEWVEYNFNKMRLQMTPERVSIIEAVREYWDSNEEVPTIRVISKRTGMQASGIMKAFPKGFETILRVAGL